AALECVPDILDRKFDCSGKIEYGTEAVTCGIAHGRQTLMAALANSCNCAYAQVAELVGRKNMRKYVEQFGVADSVSFDGITSAKGNYDISQ
ncbi:penicillin-binding transpeptidase domain-containing protein, partial [Klebsiella pneumoniae]|uniref:penicillin-binding transpeptidase domain-containing protein n=1 Tax=Klebsiella pneumoniae TaxID=573 RepID=UPI0025A29A49